MTVTELSDTYPIIYLTMIRICNEHNIHNVYNELIGNYMHTKSALYLQALAKHEITLMCRDFSWYVKCYVLCGEHAKLELW